MQEFSSISVSSYEPGSLADRLSEQSAAGWSVVSIVPTGSTITAYLSRERSDAGDESEVAPAAVVSAFVPEPEPEPEPDPEPEPEPEPIVEEAPAAEPSISELAAAIAAAEAASSAADHVATTPTIDPVDEPAGWAVAPESASDTGGAAEVAASVAPEPEPEPEPEPVAVAATTTAAAASAAPAGWYADPSSRYELRYWDGTQWTEHVSRAGQQFTDPPVA